MTRKNSRLVLGLKIGALSAVAALAACKTSTQAAPAATNTASVAVPAASERPTFSEEGIRKLETQMASFVEEGKLHGIATRLVKGGETVSDMRAGVMQLKAQTPIAEDTIYRIYSMSKPITGAAMMQLWEQGKFKLDDPVTDYIPEFKNLKVLDGTDENGDPILVDMERSPTIKELMNHTAGFAYGISGTDAANKAFRDKKILGSPDLQTFIDRVATAPLLTQPGEKWIYSASVDIQGYLVEKLSGQTFGEYLKQNIFDPLGMVDTAFYVPEKDYDRFSEVYGYHPASGDLVPMPYPTVQFKKSTVGMESGGGGLVSTMDDYARFAQMMLSEGTLNGAKILKPSTVQLMATNTLKDGAALGTMGIGESDEAAGLGFGLDIGIFVDPAKAGRNSGAGSYFWGGAAGTWFWVDPVNDLFFIGMIQVFDNGDKKLGALNLSGTSSDLVYEALNK